MKTALFAAAFLMSSAAFAQTTTPDPVDTTPPPVVTTTPAPADSATSPVVMPSNSAPERDARGIPVISAPAVAPAGFNQAPGMNGVGGPYVDPSQPPAPTTAMGDYPPCTRTVTDHCIQTYERGVRAARRHR